MTRMPRRRLRFGPVVSNALSTKSIVTSPAPATEGDSGLRFSMVAPSTGRGCVPVGEGGRFVQRGPSLVDGVDSARRMLDTRSMSSRVLMVRARCSRSRVRRRARPTLARTASAPRWRLRPGPRHIQTVFVVVMENANWSQIRGNPRAPYLNGTLLPASAHAEQYYNPPAFIRASRTTSDGSGTDYGIRDDRDRRSTNLRFTDHLVTLLARQHFLEELPGGHRRRRSARVASHGLYAAKHNPFVFFDDVTGDQAFCVAHKPAAGRIWRATSRTRYACIFRRSSRNAAPGPAAFTSLCRECSTFSASPKKPPQEKSRDISHRNATRQAPNRAVSSGRVSHKLNSQVACCDSMRPPLEMQH